MCTEVVGGKTGVDSSDANYTDLEREALARNPYKLPFQPAPGSYFFNFTAGYGA